MLEWGVPAANQAFREILVARFSDGRVVDLDPGLNELGLSRLSQRTDARAIQHSRLLWALCFATGPLALFSLGIAGVVRRFSAAIAVSVTAIVLYWAFMASIDEALREGALRGAGAWVGNVVFLLVWRADDSLRAEDLPAEAGSHELKLIPSFLPDFLSLVEAGKRLSHT